MSEKLELNQMRTTIWIRKGTKKQLDEKGSRKDTYDDIIKKLINENDQLKLNLNLMKNEPKNKIIVSVTRESKAFFKPEGHAMKRIIEYVYIPPIMPIDDKFRFNVLYKKIIYNGKVLKPNNIYASREIRVKDYLRIIEGLVQEYFDKMFRIDEKHLLDLDWWDRMLKNLGLPKRTYNEDIKEKLGLLGVIE